MTTQTQQRLNNFIDKLSIINKSLHTERIESEFFYTKSRIEYSPTKEKENKNYLIALSEHYPEYSL